MDSNTNPNISSNLCLAYESFESFLQNLEPVKLSHDTENAHMHVDLFPSATLPKDIPKVNALDSSKGLGGERELQGGNCEEEVKRLQELVELLQVRLDALQKVLEIQEQEVCREMAQDASEKTGFAYEKLLTRWRREVCIMLLKQRVDALQVEQRQLQHTQKEQHLKVQLHEARALVEVFKQKERNSQAEIAILTTSSKVAEMTMRAEGARRQHEMVETLKRTANSRMEAISHVLELHFDMMSRQMSRISDASCRLDMQGRRLFFAEQQVAMAAGLISSELRPKGFLLSRRKGDFENIHMDRRKDRAIIDQRSTMDQVGRAKQLEALLAATKTQLAEECLHARELQERLGKSEVEARESTKRATKKVQEQADRDLVAIKRQHNQGMQALHQKLVKMQAEHARSIVAHHQLERKLSQQQQESTNTLIQRDSEWQKKMDAKEVEVNSLLDEQNALLVKLKKFWRPILNSSSAKIFNEKTTSSAMQTPRGDTQDISPSLEVNSQIEVPPIIEKTVPNLTCVETQTEDTEKKKPCIKSSTCNRYQDSDALMPPYPEVFNLIELKEKGPSCSRLSTPGRRSKQKSKPKKNDEDLIISYLAKLQKAYVKAEDLSKHFMTSPSLDSLLQKVEEEENLPSTSSPMLSPTLNKGSILIDLEAKHTPQSSVDSKESSDWNGVERGNVPKYIICVPHRESLSSAGSTFYLKTRRKKKVVDSNRLLRARLENLEALSESLLNKGPQL